MHPQNSTKNPAADVAVPEASQTASQAPKLPCFLAYSHVDHCPDMNMFLTLLRSELDTAGYRPVELSDKTRSSEDYLMNLDSLIGDSVLGVVMLDGLRPNVPYELGYLRGHGKPVIILQSKTAEVCIKTLYRDCAEANLGARTFQNLWNPPLRVKDHFSDFGGKHIAFFDKQAVNTSPEHLQNVVRKELEKAAPLVAEDQKRIQRQAIPADLLSQAEPLITEVTRQLATEPAEVDIRKLRKAYEEMAALVKPAGATVPAGFLRTVTSTALRGYEGAGKDADRIMAALNLAAQAYEQLLAAADNEQRTAEAQFGLGYTFAQLARYCDRAENCKKAIAAFEQALSVYTRDKFPMDFAMTQNNLGTAFGTLAEVEDKPENCKKAIAAYKQALSVYTRDKFPMGFAMTQNNLGTAFRTLAEVEDKPENCKKAIDAYKQALSVRTRDKFPMDFAMTQNNLGTAFRTLAEVEDKPENCKKAIAALSESADVFRAQRCPGPLAIVERNLAQARAFCSGGKM